jgi:adenosine deaminase
VTLGLYRGLEEHPLELLRRSGVLVSINTDDPALLGITLVEEYARCIAAYAWTDEELRAIARTSIEASFAPVEVKSRLAAQLARWC